MHKINIILVDDHPMVVAGLITLLKPYRHIKVIATYTQATALLEGLKRQLPDVLLLDLVLPDWQGKELVSEILTMYPKLKILVLTSIDIPAMVSSMMRRGCRGYLMKGAGPAMLAEAIETVNRDEEYIEPALQELLLQNVTRYKTHQEGLSILPELSQREKEILKLIAEENTTKEISEKLYISYRTAENHRYNLIQKLDVKNTAGLIKVAIQLGLI
jgi:DNA-binding NarL/FixJ family response regulator